MQILELTDIGKIPGTNGKAFLNGEDVSSDTYKVEINLTDILLYRIKRPTELTADGQDVVRYVTEIDQIKVNA